MDPIQLQPALRVELNGQVYYIVGGASHSDILAITNNDAVWNALSREQKAIVRAAMINGSDHMTTTTDWGDRVFIDQYGRVYDRGQAARAIGAPASEPYLISESRSLQGHRLPPSRFEITTTPPSPGGAPPAIPGPTPPTASLEDARLQFEEIQRIGALEDRVTALRRAPVSAARDSEISALTREINRGRPSPGPRPGGGTTTLTVVAAAGLLHEVMAQIGDTRPDPRAIDGNSQFGPPIAMTREQFDAFQAALQREARNPRPDLSDLLNRAADWDGNPDTQPTMAELQRLFEWFQRRLQSFDPTNPAHVRDLERDIAAMRRILRRATGTTRIRVQGLLAQADQIINNILWRIAEGNAIGAPVNAPDYTMGGFTFPPYIRPN